MQLDVDDALRGHVFAIQDSLFWMAFILAITLAASVIPPDGHEPALVLAGVGRVPGRAGRTRRHRSTRCAPRLR